MTGTHITRVIRTRITRAGLWLNGGVREARRLSPTQVLVLQLALTAAIGLVRFTGYPPAREAILSRHGRIIAYAFDDLFLLFMVVVMITPIFVLQRSGLPRWFSILVYAALLAAFLALGARQLPVIANASL